MHRLIGFLLLVSFCAQPLAAQNTVEMMFYNVLNFPNPVPDGRWDTLRTILEYRPVDILMICELKSEDGADLILEESLNVNGETAFARADYLPQQSNPGSSWPLQQMLYYDSEKFTLQSQDYQLTQRRDINEYVLYYNDPNLAIHQDTTFLDIYVLHLKSGDSSGAERKRMVDSLYAHLADRPANRNVVLAGDFNIYNSSESAYQRLINAAEGGIFVDPLYMPGSWHNSFALRNVHTQSTRESSLYGDGSGGGMDDRFDFILLSNNMFGNGDFAYWPGSYTTLGNTGNCFNDAIVDCGGGGYPEYMLGALYNMSDHLPVYLELVINETTSLQATDQQTERFLKVANSANVGDQLQLWVSGAEEFVSKLLIYDQLGRPVIEQKLHSNGGLQQYLFNVSQLRPGLYYALAPELNNTHQLSGIPFVKR